MKGVVGPIGSETLKHICVIMLVSLSLFSVYRRNVYNTYTLHEKRA
jgi:uncharacterized MnhB-related membrane protein